MRHIRSDQGAQADRVDVRDIGQIQNHRSRGFIADRALEVRGGLNRNRAMQQQHPLIVRDPRETLDRQLLRTHGRRL